MQHPPETPKTATDGGSTVFRSATATDRDQLRRLSELDSAPELAGEILVAERAGKLVAAMAVETGSAIADPFQRTAPVVRMLALQRRDLHRALTAGRRRLWAARRRHEELTGLTGVGG